MNKKTSALLVLICCVLNCAAQLNITPATANTTAAMQMAQQIMGPGSIITNATLSGANGQAGFFSGNSSLGLDSGIILTTGKVLNVRGPNNLGNSTYAWGTAGDADLAAMVNQPTSGLYDACVLEFDVQLPGTSVAFNYIFGSEEYPEFVCSPFNDAFAIFISGPGISGLKNIALVPGTNIPVTISSINNGVPGSLGQYGTCTGPNQSLANALYYVSNGDGTQAPYNTSAYYIQYDGFTTALTAGIAGLQLAQTYHIKIAIADVGDPTYDSGLFIASSTCHSSPANSAKLGKPYTTDPFSKIAVGGCSTGTIPIKLPYADTVTRVVKLLIYGTAVNGTDYLPIADSVIFNPGDTLKNLLIQPITSAQSLLKTVIVRIASICDNFAPDTLFILDSLDVKIIPTNATVCPGQPQGMQATGGINYTWLPATGLNDSAISNPEATIYAPITYTCISTVGSCTSFDTMHIDTTHTFPGHLRLSPHDTTVCSQTPVNLQATGGLNFVWTPGTTLWDSTTASVIAVPNATTTYTCTASVGTCTATDSLVITISNIPQFTLSLYPTNATICPNDGIQLQATGGGANFIWTPADGLSNPQSADPVASPLATTTYVCTSYTGVCSLSDSLTIQVYPLTAPTFTQHGDTLVSSASTGNQWYFYSQAIAGATGSSVIINQTGYYRVEVQNAYNCPNSSAATYIYYTPNGIQQINELAPALYPNPNNGNFTIEFNDNAAKNIWVLDMMGRQVMQVTSASTKQVFDLSALPNAVYTLKIEYPQSTGAVIYRQVVVQR